MKKLLIASLFLSCSAWGAYFPPALSPSGVAASTVAVRNEDGTSLLIRSTTTLTVGGTITSITNPVTITPGVNGIPIVSTNTLNVSQQGTVTIGPGTSNIVISATSTIPVSGSLSVNNPSTGTINGVVPGYATYIGGNGTSGNLAGFRVDSSTYLYVAVNPGLSAIPIVSTNTVNTYVTNVTTSPLQVQNGAGTLTGVGYQTSGASVPVNVINTITATAVAVTTGAFGATFPSIGAAVGFVAPSGGIQASRVDISSNLFVVNQVVVSSNTSLPGARPDASSGTVMGDSYGRLVMIAGVPTAIQQSTAPAAITGTTPIVLVSSPAAGVFVHMCGCTVGNSSATDSFVTFFLRGDVTSAGSKRMMAPKANFPTGYPLNCATPFLNGRGGEQVAVQAAASVSSIYVDCTYYTSTTP